MEGAPVKEPSKFEDYISEKSHLTIRLKPKGVGEVDKKSANRGENGFQNKYFESASYENHSVTFADRNRGKSETFEYADTVATDEFDNSKIFDEIVRPKIPLFMDGFSMHYVAYGQTGSGKSHTMIGPHGVFKAPSDDVNNVDPGFGLFPRAAMVILKEL